MNYAVSSMTEGLPWNEPSPHQAGVLRIVPPPQERHTLLVGEAPLDLLVVPFIRPVKGSPVKNKHITSLPPNAFECCGQVWCDKCKVCGKTRQESGSQPILRRTDVATIKTNSGRGMKLNDGEAKVLEVVKVEHPGAKIIPHGLKLSFGDGTGYTPDLVLYHETGRVELLEVKGNYRGPGWEQGYERYRRAQDVFGKWFAFRMVDARKV